jgi:hypothetical protein
MADLGTGAEPLGEGAQAGKGESEETRDAYAHDLHNKVSLRTGPPEPVRRLNKVRQSVTLEQKVIFIN